MAINGDFYGAQNSGYVIRNGVLYRETMRSESQEDLVIYKEAKMKILIVEDGKRLHEVLINRLKKDRYQVEGCYDGNDAWKWIKEKPFAYEELLARIRVLMRNQKPESQDFFTLGDLTMDCSRHVVIRSGREIVLSGKEFALLEYLIRNKGIVLSKDSIAQQLWDYDYDGDDNIIKVYIRYLRRKIDDDFEVKLIHTVRNYGYVLREEE